VYYRQKEQTEFSLLCLIIARFVVETCRVNEEVGALGRNCLTRWVVSLGGGLRYRILSFLFIRLLTLSFSYFYR
jgi:hypothetical protein